MRRFLVRRARVVIALAAIGATGSALAVIPPVASAGAFGCTTAGSGLPWYGLNSAYTCIDVEGWSNTVVSVEGEWFGIGTLCNYRFRVRWRDIHGHLYRTDRSRIHVGCRVAAGWWREDYGYGVHRRTGQVCVQVQQNGQNVGGAACESIHP